MNKWAEQLNIPLPECKMTGQCCRCASPSTPAFQLLQKAAEGNEFAKDFFSIFIPYINIEEALSANREIVERSLKASQNENNKVSKENIVFYYCRYISSDNKCLIHEDRPQLCRDYPDSPFLVFPSGCAFEEWSKACKDKYNNMLQELKDLKYQQKCLKIANQLNKLENKDYNFIFLIPSMSLVSPGTSWMKMF